MKSTIASLAVGSAAAFAPAQTGKTSTQLNIDLGLKTSFNPEFRGEVFDPMGFSKMHEIKGAFPNMFPHPQFLEEAEIKHGRMSMLAWTCVDYRGTRMALSRCTRGRR